MTKREWYEVLGTIVAQSNYEDIEGAQAFINHEIELLNKKSSRTSRSLTATQKANIEVKEQIAATLTEIGKPVTVTELMNSNETMRQYSMNKLSALLRQLKEEGTVTRVVEKKHAYFSIAE